MKPVASPSPAIAAAHTPSPRAIYGIFSTAIVCAQNEFPHGGSAGFHDTIGDLLKPTRIANLLLAYIDSVEQCEALVALYKARDRWWTASSMARELFVAESPIARDLEILATRGLLEVRIGNDVLYRFSPASPEMGLAVSELAEAYRTNRVDVLSLIIRRKGRSFKHFAEAFDFRKDRRS